MDLSSRHKIRPMNTSRRIPLGDATSKANSMAQHYSISNHNSNHNHDHNHDLQQKQKQKQYLTVHQQLLPIPSVSVTTDMPQIIVPTAIESKRVSTTSQAASLNPLKSSVGPWQLGKTIGKGGSCTVRQVRHKFTGQIAVAKIINTETADKVRARSLANLHERVGDGNDDDTFRTLPIGLEREVSIMRLLDHPNIVKIYDVWENSGEVYIILEYFAGGELFNYLGTNGPIEEGDAVKILRQMLAAILYCHRFQIFHRDLKPENVLIEPKTLRTKLIDFGMAAYQPTGDLLHTPCGSPHYAAPELLAGQPYDGNKADVWSVGVIFYTMLVGDLPFNYPSDIPAEKRMTALYDSIKSVRLKVPTYLQRDVKDLFRRVFIADPSKRISMSEMWYHPLLQKYNLQIENGTKPLEFFLGPAPTLDNWEPLTEEIVDKIILRSLSTLWHESDDAYLIQRLCSMEMNKEKYFYRALWKFRDEFLDNMVSISPGDGLIASESDYHHVYAASLMARRFSKHKHQRSTSKFSVYNEEHLTSKHSFFEGEESVANLLKQSQIMLEKEYGKLSASNRTTGYGSLRAEAVKNHHKKRLTTSSGLSRSISRISVTSKSSRPPSRASISASSLHGAKSPPRLVISRRHRHNVSFNHVNHSGKGHRKNDTIRQLIDVPRCDSPCLPASPIQPTQPMEFSLSPPIPRTQGNYYDHKKIHRKLLLPKTVPQTIRSRKLNLIDTEARKVSTELEKVCEEAFFNSSLDSSDISTATDNITVIRNVDTPPSSVSNKSNTKGYTSMHRLDRSVLDRPLPPAPNDSPIRNERIETPGTFVSRQIEGIKQQLAMKYPYKEGGYSSQQHINDIIEQLDNLMPPQSKSVRFAGKSHHSTTGHTYFDSTEHLQSIPEEIRTAGEGSVSKITLPTAKHGVLSNDFATRSQKPVKENNMKNTIRMVDASSPPEPWPPLTIRKSSSNRSSLEPMIQATQQQHDKSVLEDSYMSTVSTVRKVSAKANGVVAWWRRVSQPKEAIDKQSNLLSINTSHRVSYSNLDDRVSRRDQKMGSNITTSAAPTNDGDSFVPYTPTRPRKSSRTHNSNIMDDITLMDTNPGIELSTEKDMRLPIFKQWFQKRMRTSYQIEREASARENLTAAARNYLQNIPSTQAIRNGSSADRNLLQRFFRFKPVSTVIIINKRRSVARALICAVLQAQDKLGIGDLTVDANNINCYNAQLESVNVWGLKSVSFAIEFFSILEGEAPKLTAVRFTQTRGSAASLRKLGELLSRHLEHSHLHNDTKETKEIARLVQTGRVDSRNLD